MCLRLECENLILRIKWNFWLLLLHVFYYIKLKCFYCSQRLKLFDLQIFWLWVYLTKVIPGKCLQIFWLWVYLTKVIPGKCLQIFWIWVYLTKVIPGKCTKFDIYVFITVIFIDISYIHYSRYSIYRF